MAIAEITSLSPSSLARSTAPQTVVVIGNGMVGQRFCERLVEFDTDHRFRIVTFCEEPRAAYDRVGLTGFFAHRDAEQMMLARREWYAEHGVELHVGDRACAIDRQRRVIRSDKGQEIAYDYAILATGSVPFVPAVPGIQLRGAFVYRTIEDLQHIIEYAKHSRRCAVLGGGLLGLEAAKAAFDLGLETTVLEHSPRLMPRQLDETGSRMLRDKIESLGVNVLLRRETKSVAGAGHVERVNFNDGTALDCDMLIIAAGIRPRDELAKQAGLQLGERGGIAVDDRLCTSDPRIMAVGECALHDGRIYGLVAPGYEMAEIAAANLTGSERHFSGTDLSAKLKLMGIDMASFGEHEPPADQAKSISYEDPFTGVYKKLYFSLDGTKLRGGMLVGDAAEYTRLVGFYRSGSALPCSPHELILGKQGAPAGCDTLDDSTQICSCNNVSKGTIATAVRNGAESVAAIKSCTKAGAGCGGCQQMITDLIKSEMKKSGKKVVDHLCEHFAYSRTELFAIIKVKELRSWNEVLAHCGSGQGCEVCKPTIASILASLWNDVILEPQHETLQDSNDRFLANIQRGGLYSVVPRVPGGEITPDKLATIAHVANRYGLYTKITGGQRIDLFGARVQDLPDIWEQLIEAGFESGHAYGKALRTVKSCVGSTWCRYGVQDSVGFAIRVENRYKGIRAPHKIKMAVSGCTRECAEAQSKDVGLIATENGYNVYVCGNGGLKPRHAELLAGDLDEETALQYIDRFLMYYIMTADRLTRTSVWREKLEGGLDHLRQVIIEDKLGLCDELDAMMQRLVDSYQCEWAAVVRDPEKRKRFAQFANTDESDSCIEFVSEREQQRPADWPNELVSLEQFRMLDGRTLGEHRKEQKSEPKPALEWVCVGQTNNFPADGGATIKHGKTQIAVFNFASRGEWYATQNMCPHKKAFVLGRGILGNAGETPKVACPLHKKTFSLQSGESLQGEEYRIRTFPVKLINDQVLLLLPPVEELDAALATEIGCKLATSCSTSCSIAAPIDMQAMPAAAGALT